MTRAILVTATNYSRLCSEGKALLEAHDCRVIENDFGRPMTFDGLSDRVGEVDTVVADVDNIDIEAACGRGIKVTNAVGGNSNAAAELTIGLIIATMRNIPELRRTTRQGAWDRFVGGELAGRTVGILGFGNIARMIAKKLSGFDIKVIAYDKFPNGAAADTLKVSMVDADTVLTSADIVCIMLPSLPETHHFMNAQTFGRMK